MKRFMALVIGIVMIISVTLCACSNSGSTTSSSGSTSSKSTTSTTSGSSNATELLDKADYSNPKITIADGDYEGITKLASDMQNMAVDEGTVIKITGIISNTGSRPSIMEKDPSDSSKKMGISMYIEGDGQKSYEDGTKAEVIGVAVKGGYFMEFHVKTDNIKVIS